MPDDLWRKRSQDEQEVRDAIEYLLSMSRDNETSPNSQLEIHKLIAQYKAILEAYTRPIPVVIPWPVPPEVLEQASVRYAELGIPFSFVALVGWGDES